MDSPRRMVDFEDQLLPATTVRRQAGEYPARKHRITILMAVITSFLLGATIFFAYNCSLAKPVAPSLRFAIPERNVFVLTLLTQLTIFSLAELTSTILDLIRWAFSCSARGVSAFTFLALSRATNILGVLYLVLGTTRSSRGFGTSGHRLWGCQRLSFVLVRLALGVLLLSDISFDSAYNIVDQFPIESAGQPPMTSAITNYFEFSLRITAIFWFYFPGILFDGRNSIPISPPSNCTSDKCSSYFIPGYLSTVNYTADYNITASNYSTADTFITIDAPGYQVDFGPPESSDPPVTLEDCQLFGYDKISLQICLKQTDRSTFIAAWAVCPTDTGEVEQCLTPGLSWQTVAPANTKMTVLSRRATTAFNRRNGTITDIISWSDPSPTNYTVDNFFTIYKIMFALDSNSTVPIQTTVNYDFLYIIGSYLSSPSVSQIDQDSTISKVQQFLATSLILFTPINWPGVAPLTDMGTQAALGVQNVRLVIAPYTLYGFMIGGFVSLGWCLIALILILRVATPNLSLYPEIDVAGKVVHENSRWTNRQSHYSISGLLSSLSNAGTGDIRKQMSFARFYTRISTAAVGRRDRPPVVIALQESEALQQLTRQSVLIMEERRP